MKFRLTLAVWGKWHLDQFETNALPSLRASGNLDAIDYHISAHTRPADRERLASLLQGFNADIKTPIRDDVQSDQGTSNDTVFGRNIDDRSAAAAAGEAWALLSPDMVWGEGTFAHYRRLFEAGKKAIFRPLLRVDSERAGIITDFGKRALARIALEHEHDIARRFYRADGKLFSSHAEMVIWPAPGGLINKTITAETQVCMPAAVQLDGQGLAPDLAPDEMAVICDSDESISLAMTAPGKDFSWLLGTEPLKLDIVRAFLKWYYSPACQHIAAKSYRLHDRDIDPAAWEQIERHADDFIKAVFESGTDTIYQPGAPAPGHLLSDGILA
jgi:hypothetical protein